MTTKFPDLLPLPLVEEYSITPNEAIIRTQMESGTARQRRRFDSVPSRIIVKWFMNASQFSLFEAWYKYHAKEGAEWFVIPLLGGLHGGDQGWFPEYIHGLYEKDNLQMFVTSGLGSSGEKLPRFNNLPEMAVYL